MNNRDESFFIDQILMTTSTPAKVAGKEQLKDKPYMYDFLASLLGISMSNKVLADIFIRDDPDYNTINIVGRPQVLGSASKQMRHVTPYVFIIDAIAAQVKKISFSKQHQIIDFARDLLCTLLPLSPGICLSNINAYEKLRDSLGLEQNSECFDVKMITKDRQDKESTHYLISDDDALEECKLLGLYTEQAKDDYDKRFHKYIMYGLNYLENIVETENNKNTLTFAFQGIAQLILTIFNQKPGICFADEANSLQYEEFRLYNNSTQALKAVGQRLSEQQYQVQSHKSIIKEIHDGKENFVGKSKESCIRRVNNEGPLVKDAIEALHIINRLMSLDPELESNLEESNKLCERYNENFNSQLKIDSMSLGGRITLSDLIDKKKLTYYTAKHLYIVFDFKPLEKEVLVAKQSKKDDEKIISVYPTASDKNPAEYSIKNGDEYRELQYNARKGYNKHALFRYKIEKDDKFNDTTQIKELLTQAIIMHIHISLLPFDMLSTKTHEIFSAFKEVVCADYNSIYEDAYLSNEWRLSLDEKFNDACNKINDSINRSKDPSSFIEGIQFPIPHRVLTP